MDTCTSQVEMAVAVVIPAAHDDQRLPVKQVLESLGRHDGQVVARCQRDIVAADRVRMP